MRLSNQTIRNVLNASCGFFGRPWIAFPVVPADNRVLFFDRDREDFGFLSNFYPCNLRIAGRAWPHIEAYYQSQKSENPTYHDEILRKDKPSWSKYVGDSRIGGPRISKKSWFRKHPEDLRSDWEAIKLEVMKTALHAKFTQHRNLQLALLNSWPAELVEDSPRDAFWGYGENGRGMNMLGTLLIELRAWIREGAERGVAANADKRHR